MISLAPGSRSQSAATRLGEVESAAISAVTKGFRPFFWHSGTDARLTDLDGNTFIDMTSSFGVASTGYSHPSVVAAICDQAPRLLHTMAGIFPHIGYVDLLEEITASVGRWSESQALLTTSGSEAVEVALKLAMIHTGRAGVIAFKRSFHGQTLGCLSVTGQNPLREPFSGRIGGETHFVPYPDPYRPWSGSSDDLREETLNEAWRTLQGSGAATVPIGAILVEPMQNAGGYIVPPPGFLAGLRDLCDRAGVLLICDEIFTGFGRTGAWLAADHESVVPDIVCVGKGMSGGLPIAACVGPKSIMRSMMTTDLVPLHGSTFQANPIATAAATAAIRVLHSQDLVSRAQRLGNRIEASLIPLADKSIVGVARGIGAAWAVEFVTEKRLRSPAPDIAQEVARRALSRGVVTLVTGLPTYNSVALCPPLVISEDDLTYALEVFTTVVTEVSAETPSA